MKKRSKIIPTVLILIASSIFACNQNQDKRIDNTQILVVGTIHGNHNTNPNYSFQDVLNILGTFNPDVICVEIPPSYFRKRSYLHEMMLATIYGLDHKKAVYPIDWWTPGDDRAKRDEFMKTVEFETKEKQISELVEANSIMQNFIKKYGSMDSIWDENKRSYTFFNGKEYNDYIKEMYAVSMAVYGDGPMNLSYETRNNKMLELINNATKENKGKRIIVLTGAEHKHYFDIALSKQAGLKVVDFNDILPLKKEEPTQNLTDFLEKKLARGYYDVSDSSSIDLLYQGVLIELIHGQGMDHNPDIIPSENIEKAKPILDEWGKQNPKSVYLQFEKAWIAFLKGKYDQAVTILENIANKLDEIPENDQWFVKSFYYRNLGFCYDMLGNREKAIACYKACKNACKELKINEAYAKTIYNDYELKPYKRQMNY